MREIRHRLGWKLGGGRHAAGRTSVDRKRWSAEAQGGELAFHKRPNTRSDPSWDENNTKRWRRFGFEPHGWGGKLIVDVGAGSRLRTLFFEGARIAAIEPLASEFIAEVEWQDLDKADEIYPVPAEEEIPELVGRADLVVSINTLDHGFDFERAIRNIRRYLKDDGQAFLSFDQHSVPDSMHPLVLNDQIVRQVFDRCGLEITGFVQADRYHGGAGPEALNYWLIPRSATPPAAGAGA
jgi:SAM-dependent methyltransferase